MLKYTYILAVAGAAFLSARPAASFDIDDYFKVQRVKEVALSSDGSLVAYRTERWSLEENSTISAVYLQAADASGVAEPLAALAGATDLAFVPGSHRLAFLSVQAGGRQVHSYDPASGSIAAETHVAGNVSAYGFAPDGSALAFTVAPPPSNQPSLYQQLQTAPTGVSIPSDDLTLYAFTSPSAVRLERIGVQFWLRRADRQAAPIDVAGSVTEFHWSPDGARLSLIVDQPPRNAGPAWDKYTSVAVLDVATRELRWEAKWQDGPGGDGVIAYAGGEFVTSADTLLVRRFLQRAAFSTSCYKDLLTIDLAQHRVAAEPSWSQISDCGVWPDHRPTYTPIDGNRLLVERGHNGVRTLERFERGKDPVRVDLLDGTSSSVSFARFSGDGTRIAFAGSRMSRLPEIYLSVQGRTKQISDLNRSVRADDLVDAREVHWQGTDGHQVSGWLLEPKRLRRKGPLPLVVMVHGGPGVAITDYFPGYFATWPYPFEVMAVQGIAVFLPNYRGSGSYDGLAMNGFAQDQLPVDDIISGIKSLIADGVADPARLGIWGHSHGGWLGGMVMTKWPVFRAASLAEGVSDMLLNYQLMRPSLNRVNHQRLYGGDPFESPAILQRYIEQSPDFHFDGLRTAVTYESGVQSVAIAMLPYAKASLRAGAPYEFVVYPRTGHNPSEPRLMYDSALRNLQWARFWLLDETDRRPEWRERFAAWAAMKAAVAKKAN